jgi:hypothetical protein
MSAPPSGGDSVGDEVLRGRDRKMRSLPHELSIWRKAPSQKVLNVTWDDADKIVLITYEPGEWEGHLASEEGGQMRRAGDLSSYLRCLWNMSSAPGMEKHDRVPFWGADTIGRSQ